MNINHKEILRYLGFGKAEPDAQTESNIAQCLTELTAQMAPRCAMQTFTASITNDTLVLGHLTLQSKNLCQHLNGCTQATVFAATLGTAVDRLIARTTVMDMSKAVILQACAAAVIEAFCDEQQDLLAQESAAKGLFLRPRFSPGYGDFPLHYQKDLLATLQAQKQIGLTVTETALLIPSKSVTAIIGHTTDDTTCHLARCMICTAKNCPFRKED